jgi:hypothetical protein
VHHRFDGAAHEYGGVVVDFVADAFGETLRQLLHGRAHRSRQVERVRARQLEHRDRNGRLAVEHAAQRVVVGTQLEPCDIAQVRGLAVGAVLDHDVAELLLGLQRTAASTSSTSMLRAAILLGSSHRRIA